MFISGRRIDPRLGFVFLFLLFSGIRDGFAQCCSTGSPVGASVYVGVMGRNSLRVVAYYRHSFSDTYYSSTSIHWSNTALESANYNFAGIMLGYGITKRLTAELDFGYFFNKTQVYKNIDFTEKGYGFSNGGVMFKYAFLVKPIQQIEVTGGLGFKYPFTTNPQEVDGVQLNRDVQASTNAFSGSAFFFFNKGFPEITLRLFTMNRYDYNFEDKNHYKYGNILLNSIFVSKKLFKYCFGILQVRSEFKTHDHDTGEEVVNTGYWILTASPTLSYSVAGKWNITAVYDIPFYKDYNGLQLTPKYAFAISLSHDFNFGPKPVKM
jgi:hypothetical protein